MRDALYKALLQKGFPEEFCRAMVDQYVTTEYQQMRMFGYVTKFSELTMEMVVDEMLAIQSDVAAFAQKKQMEAAQAEINRIYNEGLQ